MKSNLISRAAVALIFVFSTLSLYAQVYAPFRFEHNGRTVDLPTIMRETNTPNLRVAFEYDGGDTTFTASTNKEALPENTIFPVGAASSAPIVVLVLQLVERGTVRLDDPVNDHINSLEVPLNKGAEVTIRDLLLVKTKLGSGYKPEGFSAGEKIPTLLEEARRLKPRGTRGIEKSTEYGGWVLLQLLVEDVYGEDLQTIAHREIFQPLCLEDMFYAAELPTNRLAQAAGGHNEDGSKLPGNYLRYTVGCHGLWATPLDYLRLVREILAIQQGKTESILRPETAKMAMERAYGHRSLLFHLSDDGNPYWGGNAKGFFFNMQVDLKNDWVSVVAMDRQLNWRLSGPVIGQTFLRAQQWRSEDKLGIFLQEQDLDDPTLADIEHYAFVNSLKTERILSDQGFPAEITATPAYVYQSSKGRAVYSGRHDVSRAIEQFIRRSQVEPRKMVSDEKAEVLVHRRGRQGIALPIKLTAPSGTDAPAELPKQLQQAIKASLTAASGFEQAANVSLSALDRRIYLDIHPYRNNDGSYAISYALFSQFDCHTPVANNFGQPLLLSKDGTERPEQLAAAIARDLAAMLDDKKGFVPRPVEASVLENDWSDLGFGLSAEIASQQPTESFRTPLAVTGAYLAALSNTDAPGLYFSFPSPLDRYSGEVRELTAEFNFTPQAATVSGSVSLPVAAIATGSGSLDTYVLGDILKSGKFPEASLVFDAVSLTGAWFPGVAKEASIPARLTVRGKSFPVTIAASFTPDETGILAVTADFELDFKAVFGSPGPDGPDNIRRRLGFQAAFDLHPGTLK